MGTLFYGDASTAIFFDDLTLAHLRVVITTKLRRGESFSISWVHPEGQEPGRSSIWLHPTIPLRFVFDAVDLPELNREWLESLANSASLAGGVTIDPEHVFPTHNPH